MIQEFKGIEKSNVKITKTVNKISKELEKQIEKRNYTEMVNNILNKKIDWVRNTSLTITLKNDIISV